MRLLVLFGACAHAEVLRGAPVPTWDVNPFAVGPSYATKKSHRPQPEDDDEDVEEEGPVVLTEKERDADYDLQEHILETSEDADEEDQVEEGSHTISGNDEEQLAVDEDDEVDHGIGGEDEILKPPSKREDGLSDDDELLVDNLMQGYENDVPEPEDPALLETEVTNVDGAEDTAALSPEDVGLIKQYDPSKKSATAFVSEADEAAEEATASLLHGQLGNVVNEYNHDFDFPSDDPDFQSGASILQPSEAPEVEQNFNPPYVSFPSASFMPMAKAL